LEKAYKKDEVLPLFERISTELAQTALSLEENDLNDKKDNQNKYRDLKFD